MGNRAVITTKQKDLGVYLHWNGGRDSVEPVLTYCRIKGYRNPNKDIYGWARLCQVLGNCLGGGLSLGINTYGKLDVNNGDNGVYIIDENWNIAGREFFKRQEQQEYDFLETLIEINSSQPESERVEVKELCDYVIQNKGYTLERVVEHLETALREADTTTKQGVMDAVQKYYNELKASLQEHRKLELFNISVEL